MNKQGWEAFASKHYPEMAGKVVPAGVLLAWLFIYHEHPDEDRNPVVDSIEMADFIRDWSHGRVA